jgi:signal transduction histidine kinase
MVRQFVKRHMLWVGFAAVILPLGVLLGLQYFWLVDLQRKSAVAETAFLRNYLEAVSNRVEYFYKKQAERVLNLPGSLFTLSGPKKIEHHFAKKKPEGAKALFVMNVAHEDWGGTLFFDPKEERFVKPKDKRMIQAVYMALAPWKTFAFKGAKVKVYGISVEERDPGNRIMLNPITDDSHKLVGLAGMIIDDDHFRRAVLPEVIKKSLPVFDDAASRQDLQLTVHDGEGHLVLGDGHDKAPKSEITGRMAFVFSDWKLSLGGGNMTAEEWAQSNFLLNISLSALLALVLLGGIVFALRTAAREIKLSRMKADFVSNVSHELRTPIASIRVFGEFLRLGRAGSEEKAREYGEYIETESRRLTQLINNILDFSKIESGAKTYLLQPEHIESIVEGVARTLEVSLKHKGFRLEYDPPAEPLPLMEIDPDAITQALSNLVDNAVKYSGDAKEVHVRLERVDGEALISVEDRGIGISRDEQGKIFERFHRVSTGLVHTVRGSGLGLSIVSHIAQAHGGSVTVESEPGKGSRFTIHLPFHPDADGDVVAGSDGQGEEA